MSKAFTRCYAIALVASTLLFTNEVPVNDSEPLSARLVGKWQWVKTVMPTSETTSQTLGRTKSLSYGNDGGAKGNYLYMADGGAAPVVLYQNNAFGQTDSLTHSLTAQFGSQYIKFFLVKATDNTYQDLVTTDLVNDYRQGFSSIRHYYKRVGIPDQP